MTFSERHGHVNARQVLQTSSLDNGTRNRVWNALSAWLPDGYSDLDGVYEFIWDGFLKEARSSFPIHDQYARQGLEAYIRGQAFHRVFDLLEFLIGSTWGAAESAAESINVVFEQEGVGFRIVNGFVVPLTEPEQLAAVDAALNFGSDGAKSHIVRALDLLRPHGPVNTVDVVREAIHAVEAEARAVSGNSKATLGDAIKAIGKAREIHPAFEKGLLALYGYTSDEKGIRHASEGFETNVTAEDALFFVVICSAFVSWLAGQKK